MSSAASFRWASWISEAGVGGKGRLKLDLPMKSWFVGYLCFARQCDKMH